MPYFPIWNIDADMYKVSSQISQDEMMNLGSQVADVVFHVAAQDVGKDNFLCREVQSGTMEPSPPPSAVNVGPGCKSNRRISLSGQVEKSSALLIRQGEKREDDGKTEKIRVSP